MATLFVSRATGKMGAALSPLVEPAHVNTLQKANDVVRARLPQMAPTSVSERDPRTARLPKVPRQLAERLGYDMGLQLLNKFGGQQVPVPAKLTLVKGSVIARALGEEAARVMCELFAGQTVEVPTGRKIKGDCARQAILDHPGSNNEAARDLGFTRRWVRMVRNAPENCGSTMVVA